MPWSMPAMPPELLKVLGNGAVPPGTVPPAANSVPGAPGAFGPPPPPAAAPPIRMGPGGVNLAPKDPNPAPFVNPNNGSMALPQDVMRSSLAPGQQKPTASDDPGITGQLPTPPDISQSPVAAAYKRYSDMAAQREAMQPPNRADYQPNWKDKLKGGLLAAAAGFGGGTQFGAQVGRNAINSKFNRAESDYNTKTGNLDRQLEIERGGLAAAKDVGELPETEFRNKMDVAKEGRERAVGQSRIDQSEARAARLQDQIDNPAHKEPKNADEAKSAASAAYAKGDTKEGDRLANLANDLHKQEIDRVKSARPDTADKPAMKAQFATAEVKKAGLLTKAHQDYVRTMKDVNLEPGADGSVDPAETKKAQQAHDDFDSAQQEAENAYEAEVAALGGKPDHQDVTTSPAWRGATPPAAKPGQTASQPAAAKPASGKATPKVGDVRTVKGGKKVRITKLFPDGTFNADPAD